MKNFKSIFTHFLILVFLGLSTFSYGTSITSLEIKAVENEKQFLLSIETTGVGDVQISIKNEANQTILNETYESLKSFEKTLCCKEFRDGKYFLEIEDSYAVNNHAFTVSNEGVELDEGVSSKEYKPIVRWINETGNMDVHWLQNESGTVDVSIYNDVNKRLHRTRVKNTQQYVRRYKLNLLDKGNYMVIVKNDSRTYRFPISVK